MKSYLRHHTVAMPPLFFTICNFSIGHQFERFVAKKKKKKKKKATAQSSVLQINDDGAVAKDGRLKPGLRILEVTTLCFHSVCVCVCLCLCLCLSVCIREKETLLTCFPV